MKITSLAVGAVICVGILALALVFADTRFLPGISASDILEPSVITEHALNMVNKSPDAKVVDIRLVRYEDATIALGMPAKYELPEGATREDLPYLKIIGRDELVWAVAVQAEDPGQIPMFKEGPVDYDGFFAIYVASEAGPTTIRSSQDIMSDPALERLQELEDLY